MKAGVSVEFEGTFAELAAYLEATFKDPGSLALKVTGCVGTGRDPNEDSLVNAIARHTSAAWAKDAIVAALPSIVGYCQANRKIEAIKAMRNATSCGLKEAKEAVEQIVEPELSRRSARSRAIAAEL